MHELFDNLCFDCFFAEALGVTAQPHPPIRSVAGFSVLKKVWMLQICDHIEDSRAQIMSTTGRILKIDSTKNERTTSYCRATRITSISLQSQ